MGLHTYCPKCLARIEYNLKKPSFCVDCGTNLVDSASASNQPKSPQFPVNNANSKPIQQELPIVSHNIPVMRGEVIENSKDKGVSLYDVVHAQKTGFKRAKPARVNKKKEIEQFRLEAGLGGRKTIEINDNSPE